MDKNLLVEIYKSQIQSKDAYIDRIFMVNRFYMIVVIALILLGAWTYSEDKILICLSIAIIGTILTILWWLNQDAYNVMIKIKYANVIEKIEEELPLSPIKNEYSALKDIIATKKTFIFPETQKTFSVIMFFSFIIMLISTLTPTLISLFTI